MTAAGYEAAAEGADGWTLTALVPLCHLSPPPAASRMAPWLQSGRGRVVLDEVDALAVLVFDRLDHHHHTWRPAWHPDVALAIARDAIAIGAALVAIDGATGSWTLISHAKSLGVALAATPSRCLQVLHIQGLRSLLQGAL